VGCPVVLEATAGVAYLQKAVGGGGLGPALHVWSLQNIVGGPPTPSINTTGFVSGTFVQGTISFSVRLTDGVTTVNSGTCTLTVYTAPTIPSCPPFVVGTGEVGVTIANVSVTVQNGSPNGRVFRLASGQLPTGLSLTSAGVLYGTYTAAGTFTFSINMTDSAGGFAVTPSCSWVVQPLPDFTCPAATASVGVQYIGFIVGSGGVAPYTYSVATTSLPPGITVQASPDTLGGPPAIVGTYNFAVTVGDFNGKTVTKVFFLFFFSLRLLLLLLSRLALFKLVLLAVCL
jgi:hypothetical protein